MANCIKCKESKFMQCKLNCKKKYVSDSVEEKTTDVPVKQEFKKIDLNGNEASKLLGDKQASYLNKLLSSGDININHIYRRNIPLIVWACEKCNHGLVKLLIKHGVDPNVCCNEGKTALFHATKAGCLCLVELLLKQGCDANGIVDDLPYLYHAAMAFHTKVVQCLLHYGADPNAETINGGIIFNLHSEDQLEILKLLLSHGAKYIDREINFRTAAEIFVKSDNLKLLHQLLKHSGVSSYCAEEYKLYGRSLLHLAIKMQKSKSVVYLLNVGFDVNLSDACSGETPLHMAARISGNVQLIELLLSNGAWLNVKDCQGNTPLDLAVKTGHKDAIECLKFWKEIGTRKLSNSSYIETNIFRGYKMYISSKILNLWISQVYDYLHCRMHYEIGKNMIGKQDKIIEPDKTGVHHEEIEKMKDFEIIPGVSCWDLMNASKRILAGITINLGKSTTSVSLNLFYYGCLRSEFPNFDFLIWKKVMMGVKLAPVFYRAMESFETLFGYQFPCLVNEKIMDYLSVEDMENLVLSVK